jgi:predicted metal-dependent hydrolase
VSRLSGLQVDPRQALPGAAPAIFSHPEARHRALLRGQWVAYALQRARRRSIGFVVGPEGLRVRAPRSAGASDIESALQAKAAWIVRKLHEQEQLARRGQQARLPWRHGTVLPLLGRPVGMLLDGAAPGVVLSADGAALHVGLPHDTPPPQIRDAVCGWLQQHARQTFVARCRHFEPLLGVQVQRLGLSSAATRWGSASADGSIRLNWRLVHCAPPTIDYVVVHELAHLREMNHGPAFWQIVRAALPDFQLARDALRTYAPPVFD